MPSVGEPGCSVVRGRFSETAGGEKGRSRVWVSWEIGFDGDEHARCSLGVHLRSAPMGGKETGPWRG